MALVLKQMCYDYIFSFNTDRVYSALLQRPLADQSDTFRYYY
jgi:hypothetical protein